MSDKVGIRNSLRLLPRHINLGTFSTGFLAGIFGASATLVIINAAYTAGISQAETISWVFACWFFGACVGLILTLKYQTPMPGAWSMPGAVMVASAMQTHSIGELQSAFLVTGILVLALGVTRSIGKVMRYLPMPVVMAMVAGVLLRFGTDMVVGFVGDPLVVGVTILVFLVTTKFKAALKLPPILITFVAAIGISFATGQLDFSQMQGASFVLPAVNLPVFSIGAILSVSLPLALLTLGSDGNAQATGVLMSQGYKVPVNDMTVWSGIGGIVASFFGGHNANIAGPMTAITSSPASGKLEGRYAAAVIAIVISGAVGLFASVVVPFIAILPRAFIAVVAGLAMIGVISSALRDSFGTGKMLPACFFAFVMAAADVTFLGVGAALWALLVGAFVAWFLDPKEFRDVIASNKFDA